MSDADHKAAPGPAPTASLLDEPHALSTALASLEQGVRTRNRLRPWNEGWEHDARLENDDQDGWILSMLDLKTLLLTLFVVLVAYAVYEPERYGRPQMTKPDPVAPLLAPVSIVPPLHEQPDALLHHWQRQLQGLENQVSVGVVQGEVHLRIRDNILFESGLARLSDEGLALLNALMPALAGTASRISVEGHTDSTPIHTLRYPSNWELSSARATAVVRYLAVQGLDPNRLRAIGHADTRPVASNETPEGRAANRRVDLVVHVKEML